MNSEYTNGEELLDPGTATLKFDRKILNIVFRKRLKYIIIATLIAMVLAGIWAKVRVQPVWKANCFIIRAPKNMSTPAEMPYLYQTFDLNTVLETVRTRAVLLDVISKLRLRISPEDLYKALEVQRGNRSNVLKFSVTWNDPVLSAQLANATAESFIINNNSLQNSATNKILSYYTVQQRERTKQILDLEEQYEQFRGQYGVISIPNESQTKFDQLKAIELKMIENNLKITEMDTKIKDMAEKISKTPPEAVRSWTYTATDERKLLQLERELEMLRTKYTDDNPKIQKVLKEINDLKDIAATKSGRDIPESVTWGPTDLLDVYTIDRSRFEAEKRAAIDVNEEYQIRVNNIRAELETLTQIQKEFFELERKLQLNRDILRIIEGRLSEARMAMESNVSDYEIIELAKTPKNPEGTKRKLLVVAIGLITFLVGTVFVVGNEILDMSIKSEVDFQEVIRIPLLGVLPNEDHVDKNVFLRNMQVVTDNIVRLCSSKETPVVCFGSDIQETGKSFLMNDTMRFLIGQKKRILFIDSLLSKSSDIEPYIINNWLYDNSDKYQFDTTDTMLHKAYFLADDSIFNSLIEQSKVTSFFESLDGYDYIFWELFDCHYNIQLFSAISSASDILILIGRFKRSSRQIFQNVVQYLKHRNFSNVYGVINYVHKDYYQEKF
ncbi:MAG: hypothetical protein PHI68_02360 [Candidatus Cloacimonetes bacterium]|nr:hypothetical protein [Candidatus Cloacimonadota bacterium]